MLASAAKSTASLEAKYSILLSANCVCQLP